MVQEEKDMFTEIEDIKKLDIRSMMFDELAGWVKAVGQPAFRAKQIFEWVHEKGIADAEEMTNVPKKLIEEIKKQGMHGVEEVTRLVSKQDGTNKFLFRLQDGNVLESVLMRYKHGNSVCISSQVGCRMGCRFCASTIGGLIRNLEASEMLDQIYAIERITGERVSNIVVMGTGEPMDNYDNLVRFIRILTDENGLLSWLWSLLFGKRDDDSSTPAPAPVYSGWRTVGGKTYYYDQYTNQPVTGIQSIDNKLYYFDASGVQQPATFGIDVSKYQSSIDWDKVKTAGVEFAIIRIGYRGYGSGALVQDPKFEEHFTNARNAGLRVGIYCFSQAVNENEAREEAQACVYVLNGRQLDYPIYFDTEASGAGNGRADGLGVEDRTKCAVAFCEEVKALGYKPGVYASTTWFRKRLDMSQLSNYYIWNAHYNVASSPIACNMWQGTCTARIPGYGGQIDVNISYMG